jgi:CHAT domain-containing protein
MNRRPSPARTILVATVAAMLVVTSALLAIFQIERPAWLHFGPAGAGRPELQELVAATAPEGTRLFEGRLTGGFSYAPTRSRSRGSRGSDASPAVRIAAANLESRATSRNTPADRAAFGVASLTLGDIDKAVAALEDAVAHAPRQSSYQSDLAAAYLTRADWEDRPDDYPRALAAAERVVRLDSHAAEALFNKTLALSRLHLTDEASRARREYLAIDGDSHWARELLTSVPDLASSNSPSADLSPELREALRARDARRVQQVTAISVERARDYFELRLLDTWARAVQQRDTAGAGRALDDMRLLGDGIATVSGDRCARDTVADIVAAGQSPRNMLIAEGATAYVEGRRAYDADAITQSQPHFGHALKLLTRAHSPLRAWPAFYDCLQHYYAVASDVGRACFARVGAAAESDSDHLVAAHCRWMVGLLHSAQSRQVEALRAYRAALAELDAATDREGVASVHSLIADSLDLLGDEIDSWRHRYQALSALDAQTSPRRRHTILRGAARSQTSALPEAALYFQSAMLANANRWGRSAAAGEALLGQVQVLIATGDTTGATTALQAADQIIPTISDATVAARLGAEIAVVRGELAARSQPAHANDVLTAALTVVTPNSLSFTAPRLLLTRGRVRTAAHDLDGAERDYREGLRRLTMQWRAATTDQLKVQTGQQLWEMAMALMRQEADLRSRPESALWIADRYRQPSIWKDAPSADDEAGANPHWTFPAGVGVVSYVCLDDRLFIWVTSSRGHTSAALSISQQTLDERVQQYVRLVQANATPAQLGESAKPLYDLLVRPIAGALDGLQTWVFVLDGPLHTLPFAALVDPNTRHFLVQDHDIGIAPSVGAFLRASRQAEPQIGRERRALVVGDPTHAEDPASYPPLPAARQEAIGIAALYRDAVLLTGTDATKRRLLAALRTASVVHFAGHAVVNPKYPFRSRLLLAPADDDDGGVLYADDVERLTLAPDTVVVLAACETAAGAVFKGEGVVNLAAPFLAAGAQSAVATLWRIDDTASRSFFLQLHRRLRRDQAPVAALSGLQRDLLRSDDETLRQPSMWAAVEAIGGIPNGPTSTGR